MQMKRCLGVLCVLAMVVSLSVPASAFIVVDWQTSEVVYQHGTTVAVLDGSLVQLIWSPDAAISDISSTGSATPVGGEYVLDTLGFGDYQTSDGTVYTGAAGQGYFGVQGTRYEDDALSGDGVGDAAFLAGSVYLRVFDSAAPAVNSWYYEGALSSPLFTDPSLPDDYNFLDLAPSTSPYDLNTQLVPEPGTFALFGLGLVTMIARRRRMRK